MSPRRPASLKVSEWPPVLLRIIRAAERECPRGHAAALRELTALALTKVHSRGIFDPTARGEHELFTAIETVARTHLDLGEAREVWQAALATAVVGLEHRDEVERAALQVQSVSDTAYFYTGLAFGLASGAVYRG